MNPRLCSQPSASPCSPRRPMPHPLGSTTSVCFFVCLAVLSPSGPASSLCPAGQRLLPQLGTPARAAAPPHTHPPPPLPSLFPSRQHSPSLHLCLKRTNGSPSPPPAPLWEPPPPASLSPLISQPSPSHRGHLFLPSFPHLVTLIHSLAHSFSSPPTPSSSPTHPGVTKGTAGSGIGVRGLAPGGGMGQAILTSSEYLRHAWLCHLVSLSQSWVFGATIRLFPERGTEAGGQTKRNWNPETAQKSRQCWRHTGPTPSASLSLPI